MVQSPYQILQEQDNEGIDGIGVSSEGGGAGIRGADFGY